MFAKKSLLSHSLFLMLASISLLVAISFERVVASPTTRTLQDVFLDATLGNKNASDQVIESIESLLIQYPQDPLLAAYYGSTLSMKARDAWLPWNRERYVAMGVSTLEKSLAMLSSTSFSTPYQGLNEGFYVESLAAITFMHMPPDLDQQRRGYTMIKALMDSEALSYYSFEPRAWIHLGAVKGAIKMGEREAARHWAEQMQQLAPTHPYTIEAQTLVVTANI